MSQTRPNGIVVPLNSDAYNLAPDLATLADGVRVFKCANTAARDAIPTPAAGDIAIRNDLAGVIEVYDGAAWQRGSGSAVPAAGAGWALTGTLVRTKANAGTQIAAAFKAIYGGGSFTLNSSFVLAFTLTNAGYLPVTNDAYGYFMLRATTTRAVKADCAFTIDSTGAVYVRTLLGQASTTIAAGDELSFNTVWNA